MQPGLEKFFTETQRRTYERGREEGKTEGKAEGKTEALLRILTRRGLTLTPEQRDRIVQCTELPVLECWLDRSLTISSVDELF
jgi:predicted transposase YdaD